jgi:hypothetical protein
MLHRCWLRSTHNTSAHTKYSQPTHLKITHAYRNAGHHGLPKKFMGGHTVTHDWRYPRERRLTSLPWQQRRFLLLMRARAASLVAGATPSGVCGSKRRRRRHAGGGSARGAERGVKARGRDPISASRIALSTALDRGPFPRFS